MARARGANAQLLLDYESVYGTPEASGGYLKLPFISSTLGSQQPLEASAVLGQGRDPIDPFLGPIALDGDIVVPMDMVSIGYWLKLLFGAPTTSGAGAFDHEFVSGAAALPSAAIEVGMPDVPAFALNAGVKANTLGLNLQRSGEAQATIGLIGQTETIDSTSVDGAPTEPAFLRASQFQGTIKADGTAIADVVSATMNYSNGLDPVGVIRGDGAIAGVDEGQAACTGTIVTRFSDTDFFDAAAAETPIELELAYTRSASAKLVITLHEVRLPKPKLAVQGPGGIEANFDYIARLDGVAGQMLTAVLTNSIAAY
ncbi:phage tail tube protein [Oceanibacterium hippocampi]|uniref:Uncharacterized protein n=1 Tax=Oceanibacterium hippocampi TaxID=745714 RepID=A0A1Y5U0C7_9PROT|nr:phage tail tube protein [Oceanibacterium hippocampi]SLN77309.1 hypothetical protein OCH7691_04381 [Oceanibacterium hippocampi]